LSHAKREHSIRRSGRYQRRRGSEREATERIVCTSRRRHAVPGNGRPRRAFEQRTSDPIASGQENAGALQGDRRWKIRQ